MIKINLLKFLSLFIYLRIIGSIQIKLKSFFEIELPKGFSEYLYQYSFPSFCNTENCFFFDYTFIKLSDYTKIDLQVYLNEEKTFFDNVKKMNGLIFQ